MFYLRSHFVKNKKGSRKAIPSAWYSAARRRGSVMNVFWFLALSYLAGFSVVKVVRTLRSAEFTFKAENPDEILRFSRKEQPFSFWFGIGFWIVAAILFCYLAVYSLEHPNAMHQTSTPHSP